MRDAVCGKQVVMCAMCDEVDSGGMAMITECIFVDVLQGLLLIGNIYSLGFRSV